MKPTILVVYHSQGGATARLAEAVHRGAALIEGVRVVMRKASEATTEDLLGCRGLALGTPEYFGYMSGGLKDFFDRTYDAAREETSLKPYFVFVSAGNDGRGAISAIERIAKGYQFKPIANPLRVTGEIDDEAISRAEELGQTLAAGVEAGIF